MQVRDVPSHAALLLPRAATVKEAARRMQETGTGLVLVEDPGGRVVGCVSEPELVAALVDHDGADALLEDVMSIGFPHVFDSSDVLDAMEEMGGSHRRWLAVVDRDGELRGAVSFEDLVLAIAQELRAVGDQLGAVAPTG